MKNNLLKLLICITIISLACFCFSCNDKITESQTDSSTETVKEFTVSFKTLRKDGEWTVVVASNGVTEFDLCF